MSSDVIIRKSTLSDALRMAGNLRKEDVCEIWASHHHKPLEALVMSVEQSTIAYTVEHYGSPICMFGVVPKDIFSNRASIWMLGTEGINKIKIKFLRNNRKYIDKMLEIYGYLENYTSCENFKSLQWLRFLGAGFDAPVRYGIEQQLFQHFYFSRD